MSLMRLRGKLRAVAIAGLYVCSLLFVLPSVLRQLDRPAERLGKDPVGQGAMHFAIADLDGDLQPDTATVRISKGYSQTAEYFLELQLTSGLRPAIGILGPVGGLQIATEDVNGDKIVDLVITSPFDAHFVAILLNDGHGNFKRAAPADYPNAGKHEDSWLFSNDDATFQLTLGQNRSKDGNGLAPSSRESLSQNWQEAVRLLKGYAGIFAELSTADRAPPLV